jgi:hypothetical protein
MPEQSGRQVGIGSEQHEVVGAAGSIARSRRSIESELGK